MGSGCDEGNAFGSDIDAVHDDNTPCDAEVECKGVVAIVNGTFTCNCDEEGQVATGSFWNPTNATGAALESETSGVCLAKWDATPDVTP